METLKDLNEKMKRSYAIWISWQHHRRSQELCRVLDIPIFELISEKPYPVRVTTLSIRTILLLLKHRPYILFVQNPSIILAFLACVLANILRCRIVVDRHSNFRLDMISSSSPIMKVFHCLSRYTAKRADITIVTNRYLCDLVDAWGGSGFVLPDRIPELSLTISPSSGVLNNSKGNLVFICSFSHDEPINEVIAAARKVPIVSFFITGKAPKDWFADNLPSNVTLTGFLSEEDYVRLLNYCDVIMVLTTEDHLLVCGAYEAIALGKPMILSATETIKGYFSKGAIYVENISDSIAEGVEQAFNNLDALTEDVKRFGPEIKKDWNMKFKNLLSLLNELHQK